MPGRKQEAYRALELLEQYVQQLEAKQGSEELQEALKKAIVAIRSRLFQALLDIHEFYELTLDNAGKPDADKAEEVRQLTQKWEENDPPIPVDTKRLAQRTISDPPAVSSHQNGVHKEPVPEPPVVVAAPTPVVVMEKVKDESDSKETLFKDEVVVIERDEKRGLGLSIAGGTDNPHVVGDYGVFITKLIPESPAEKCGLVQLGDQIVQVNGRSLISVTHADAVDSLKSAGMTVELHVRRYMERAWSPASSVATMDRLKVEHSPSPPPAPQSPESRILEINLTKMPGKGLGFSIAGGKDNQHVMGDNGIFVTKIIPNGAAADDGTLAVGDRLLQVNQTPMTDISHPDAVGVLKATQEKVILKVEKNAISQVTPTSSSDVLGDTLINKPRYVILERSEGDGLGFNIIGGEEEVGIFCSVISPDGLAGRNGQLKVGDQIMEVNGQNMERWTHETAAKALMTAGNRVTLKVIYKPEEFEEFHRRLKAQAMGPSVKKLYVRALFDHDASKETGCPGEGISFKHGDILHVLNGSDDEWWQACPVGPLADDGPQGLIPSRQRIERRHKVGQKSVKFTRGEGEGDKANKKARSSFKIKLSFGKKNSNAGASAGAAEADEPKVDDEVIPTYEPVELQQRGYTRPVIILGPLKEDINDMLVQEFPEKFAGCVPHTTRKARDGELDGRDYHFVESVEQMERDIQAHLFIEAGRYKDNLYGTSIQAVREVAEQGKHCILGVSGFAIRRLVMADLLPIAVCIRPGSADVIKSAQPRLSNEQAQQMFDKGRSIEQDFADSFTAIVDGESLNDVYDKVKDVIHENSGNFIWVPSTQPL